MLDAATGELLKQGLGYVLFILSCGVITVMWRHINSLHTQVTVVTDAAHDRVTELQEKRLAEVREIVLAMERSTAASVDNTTAMTSVATAVNDLTKGFAALVLTSENSRDRFTDSAERIEARQEAVLGALSKVKDDLNTVAARVK